MNKKTPRYEAIAKEIRADARKRYARWDDAIFETYTIWQPGSIWRALEKQPVAVRERSVRIYLNLVASGIGAGHLAAEADESQTLAEFFIRDCMASWFSSLPPEKHAAVAATAWNLADGARTQGGWIESYLLARSLEFDDPLTLEQTARDLLKPVIEPQADAAWKGPFTVITIDIGEEIEGFLPGAMSMITPSLIRIDDRRRRGAAGVLLQSGGESYCIGRMDGAPSVAGQSPELDQAVVWGPDSVMVGDAVVELPLMACQPLHTLALPGGYLAASAPNSQRIWVVETP
jgi:hypothetical protein